MSRWPADNQTALKRFYGTPGRGGTLEAQIVRVVPPFQMYYGEVRIKSLLFHKKAAPALLAALNEIWEKSGRDQAKLDRLGVSKTGGTYNPRLVRGSATNWSSHAFGMAIDIDPDHNGFNTGRGNMQPFVVAAFDKQGFRWGGRYKRRTDPMHFEAIDPGNAVLAAISDAVFTPAEADELDNHVDGAVLHDDADPSQTPDTLEGNEIEAEVGTPPAAPASKVVTGLRTGAATAVGTAVVGKTVEAISTEPSGSIVERVTEIVDKPQDVAQHIPQVVAVTKQIVSVPKPGFYNAVMHFIASPAFLLSVIIFIGLSWLAIVLWQHWRAKTP
jgi:hypothetical protein